MLSQKKITRKILSQKEISRKVSIILFQLNKTFLFQIK